MKFNKNVENLKPIDAGALGKFKARVSGLLFDEQALQSDQKISPEENKMRLDGVVARLFKFGEELGLPSERIKEELKVFGKFDIIPNSMKEAFVYTIDDQIKVAKVRAKQWFLNNSKEQDETKKTESLKEERAQIIESAYQNKRTPEEAQEILRAFTVELELFSQEQKEKEEDGSAA